jgi:thiol-disulfide isomerase/thioredoxin
MPRLEETIFAPELDGGQWLHHGPIRLADLRDKAIALIDFWDYTCVNCIRTLPYVVEWHRRYAPHGLVIVGVHAPEFSFAREGSHVAEAIREFAIDYPVVLDNDYAIWRAYSNRYWPAKYLIDKRGRIRYFHFGEGGYADTELEIQAAMHDLDPSLSLPAPMAPVRDSDQPGAVCYRVTPELYLGYARGQFGNPEGIVPDRPHDYQDRGRRMEGIAYLGGRWRVEQESARAEAAGASVALRYTAKDVNLVLAPRAGSVSRMEVRVEPGQTMGADVTVRNGRAFVVVERPRMYNLIANETVVPGALELRAEEPGISAYAFTFVSCTVAPN